MARAIRHLNDKGFHHNDIKPDNFLINAKTGEVKLIDLGTLYKHGSIHATPVYNDSRAGVDSDINGLGLSMFEALEGAMPNYRPALNFTTEEAITRFGSEGLRNRFTALSQQQRQSWRDNLSKEDIDEVVRVRGQMERESRQSGDLRRHREEFFQRGEEMFRNGISDEQGSGVVPMVSEMHKFVNMLLHGDPEQRPKGEDLLSMSFLDDSIVGEDEAREFLSGIDELREEN